MEQSRRRGGRKSLPPINRSPVSARAAQEAELYWSGLCGRPRIESQPLQVAPRLYEHDDGEALQRPCPEVVQLEDEKNAAEEAERLRIKQEEEERTRLLAGSGSSKMSRFSELKSMGQAEAEQEKVSRNSCSLPASSVS